MAVITQVVSCPPNPPNKVREPKYESDAVGNAQRKNPKRGENKNQVF